MNRPMTMALPPPAVHITDRSSGTSTLCGRASAEVAAVAIGPESATCAPCIEAHAARPRRAALRMPRRCGRCHAIDHDVRSCTAEHAKPRAPRYQSRKRCDRAALGHRAVVLSVKDKSEDMFHVERVVLTPEELDERPLTRGDCQGGERPCPWVSCRHHLYLDVTPAGSIKFNFPDREVDELEQTCALDIADGGGETLEFVGRAMNLVRERVRQLELSGMAKVEKRTVELEEAQDAEGEPQ